MTFAFHLHTLEFLSTQMIAHIVRQSKGLIPLTWLAFYMFFLSVFRIDCRS